MHVKDLVHQQSENIWFGDDCAARHECTPSSLCFTIFIYSICDSAVSPLSPKTRVFVYSSHNCCLFSVDIVMMKGVIITHCKPVSFQ